MARSEHSKAANRAYMRAWRAANRAKSVAIAQKWKAEHPMLGAYWDHKSRARRRGIVFLLTFKEWELIWLESGKFDQRGGAPENYCMARYGDIGPYAVGNVRICTRRENNAEQAELLRGKPVNEKQRAALAFGRSPGPHRRGKPLSDRQREALAKAIKARWPAK